MRPVLVLDVAALSPSQIGARTPNLAKLAAAGQQTALVPPLGALTCPAHLTMATGQPPSVHGIVANGWYDRDHARVFNWNRSHRLVQAPTLFDAVRDADASAVTASLFWRHTAHSAATLKVIERPTYWASGRKTFDFYTEPGDLHGRAHAALGGFPFPFFWGPMAGWKSTRWILDLTRQVLEQDAPVLTLSYAPFMDYDGQRFGPDDPRALAALEALDAGLAPLIELCAERGVDLAIVSDYGFVGVDAPVFPNRALREAGLLAVHAATNGDVLEPGNSRAFAHCDNQIAHVYVNNPADVPAADAALRDLPGVRAVLGPAALAAQDLGHRRTGDLVLLAERNAWFAYPYWLEPSRAPDFERCIAIFDKPGFDPCELFAPPGPGGKLHLGRRVLEKKLGLAVPFDVIDPDPSRVGGARNVDREDVDNGAILITSWAHDADAVAPMEAVYGVVWDRMTG
jgi:predicted AlkP superfamily pyrophosphatase or phosphodiesterase